jgi:hypothetical protein
MSNLFIWSYSGGAVATFMEHFKGGRKLQKFGNLWARGTIHCSAGYRTPAVNNIVYCSQNFFINLYSPI